MAEKHEAEKIAKIFADTRLNELELANHTAFSFNHEMNNKLLNWFRVHHFVKNGFTEDYPVQLDDYEEM